MQTRDDPMHDPIGEVLAIGVDKPDERLRGQLLTQTIGVMRRRRRLKRCAVAASLLGCYLAGVATMAIGRREVGGGLQVAGQPAAAETRQSRPQSAVVQQQVPAEKLDGFESWRRMGDHYLSDGNNIELALSGYSQALDLASDEELAIAPERDNWLLMALKDARIKERKHARVEQN